MRGREEGRVGGWEEGNQFILSAQRAWYYSIYVNSFIPGSPNTLLLQKDGSGDETTEPSTHLEDKSSSLHQKVIRY